MAIEFTNVSAPHQVDLILELQIQNHRDHVDAITAASDGFTSVRHDRDVLQAMNRQHHQPLHSLKANWRAIA